MIHFFAHPSGFLALRLCPLFPLAVFSTISLNSINTLNYLYIDCMHYCVSPSSSSIRHYLPAFGCHIHFTYHHIVSQKPRQLRLPLPHLQLGII